MEGTGRDVAAAVFAVAEDPAATGRVPDGPMLDASRLAVDAIVGGLIIRDGATVPAIGRLPLFASEPASLLPVSEGPRLTARGAWGCAFRFTSPTVLVGPCPAAAPAPVAELVEADNADLPWTDDLRPWVDAESEADNEGTRLEEGSGSDVPATSQPAGTRSPFRTSLSAERRLVADRFLRMLCFCGPVHGVSVTVGPGAREVAKDLRRLLP